jgi:uncharacterized protein
MKEEKIFFKNSYGLKLCGILEEPNPKKERVVVIVHGFSSNKNRTSSKIMSEELTRRGINSFRIDLNGCGESEGKFEDHTTTKASEDTIAAIKLMKERGYLRIDLFGSSAGGITVMAAALKFPETGKIGLKAPVSNYISQTLNSKTFENTKNWKEKGFAYFLSASKGKVKLNYSFFEDAQKNIMYDKVKNITCPVLIIHGNEDKDVNLEQSKKVVEGFPDGSLIILEGADHALSVNEDREPANKMFGDWFDEDNK